MLLLSCCVVASLHSAAAVQQQANVPRATVKTLDAQHPGWTVAKVTDEVRAYSAKHYPGTTPNVVRGDFDGNGVGDVAILIEQRKAGSTDAAVKLLAFMGRDADNFRAVVLGDEMETGPTVFFIAELVPRGSKGFDLNTDKTFTVEHDSIRFRPSNSGPCTTFVYRDNVFIALWTCD